MILHLTGLFINEYNRTKINKTNKIMEFKRNDIVVCIDGGNQSSTWRLGDIHRIINNMDNYFLSWENKNIHKGIWFNSVRLATKEEIDFYNSGGRNIKDMKNNEKSSTPTFEKGKWYKSIGTSSDYYLKDKFENNSSDIFKEHIYNGKYYSCSVNLGGVGIYKYQEVSIEEIQKWLPEGHIDKLPIVAKEMSKDSLLEKAKRDYPIGTKFYFAHLVKSSVDYKDEYIGEIINNDFVWENGKRTIKTKSKFNQRWVNCVYFEGNWAKIISKPENSETTFRTYPFIIDDCIEKSKESILTQSDHSNSPFNKKLEIKLNNKPIKQKSKLKLL